ncbi:MAG TPA: hypothetical protein VMF65_01245 [Acidimicrobiales bacterium]|nr:hypothetical protein [Acidimicrobiales bacterium]
MASDRSRDLLWAGQLLGVTVPDNGLISPAGSDRAGRFFMIDE